MTLDWGKIQEESGSKFKPYFADGKYTAKCDGVEIKEVGTDLDKIMPPVSRFGGGNRTQKKQSVLSKLKAFFEKYFGIGGTIKFSRNEEKED